MPEKAHDDTRIIPVLEEEVRVERRESSSGLVRVRTRTAVETELVGADLEHITVEVKRVPVGREVEGEVPKLRTEGNVTIIPVLEEVLVVEKRLVLKEEIHLIRREEQEH